MKRFLLLISMLLIVTSVGAAITDYNSSLVLILHANQSPANPTYFNDSSTKGHIFTTVGGASTNTSQKQFGNASGYFDGAGDYVKGDGSSDFAFGTGDFTVVFWIYRITSGTQILYDHRTAATSVTPVIWISGTNNISYYVNGANRIGGSYSIPATTWMQVALIRESGSTKLYLNGVQNGSTYTDSNNYVVNTSGPMLAVDASSGTSGYFTGHIDELAVWKGVAVPIADLYPQSIEFNTTGTEPVSVASFTSSKNPSFVNENITFTDTSTGTPTTWNISFDNMTTWDNSSSPPWYYNFTSTGAYNVTLICNNTVGESDPFYLTQVVTNATGFTPQDVWQVGQYTRQFVITSSATGLPISGALVEAPGGLQNTSISNGSAWITEPFGSYSHTITATGYTGRVITLVYDSDAKTDIQLTPSSSSSNYNVRYPPKDIRFHVQTASGAPITLAFVEAVPYHTPLGSYEYVASLFGYDLGVVPLDTLSMNGSTDSHGDISFAMMTDVQYYVTATKTGYTFTPLNITPHDDNYLIIADYTGSLFVTNGTSPAASVRFNTSYTRVNQTTGFINLSVVDTAGAVTGGTMNITQKNTTVLNSTARVQIASVSFTGNISRANFTLFDGATTGCPSSTSTIYNTTGAVVGCMNKTLVDDASYQTGCMANTPTGTVYETGTVWFKKLASPIAGLSPEFALFIGLSIMMFTALMAGTSTAGPVALVVTFEGWVMYGMNMFVLMETPDPFTGGTTNVVPAALTVMTFITIVWLFVDYRRKGK